MNDRSREGLIEFLDWLTEKGLMPTATAKARKAACNVVLDILSNEEAGDVSKIDIDDLMRRFQNLHGKKYSPGSLRSYRSRVSGSLDDFAAYLADPAHFKPSAQRRKSRAKKALSNIRPIGSPPSRGADEGAPQIGAADTGKNTIPIPIRQDTVVQVANLPFDLSKREATKIANVVMALAMDED